MFERKYFDEKEFSRVTFVNFMIMRRLEVISRILG